MVFGALRNLGYDVIKLKSRYPQALSVMYGVRSSDELRKAKFVFMCATVTALFLHREFYRFAFEFMVAI
jgi:hypothetical protein